MLLGTRDLYPREAVQGITSAVIEACRGSLPDDATMLCLDWYGTQPTPAYAVKARCFEQGDHV